MSDIAMQCEMSAVMEIWRPVLGGLYEASNLGRIRRAVPGRRTWPGRILQLRTQPNGYCMCAPTLDGRNRNTYVHTLVAHAFLGPCPDGLEVNHLDGDKANNRANNLEYVTRSGNMQHAIRIGLAPHMVPKPRAPKAPRQRRVYRGDDHWTRHKPEHIARGERSGKNKVSAEDVQAIRLAVAQGRKQRDLCAIYHLSPAQICRIAGGTRWTA